MPDGFRSAVASFDRIGDEFHRPIGHQHMHATLVPAAGSSLGASPPS
jgi:hypothetical protein